jgi:hypothetical protein
LLALHSQANPGRHQVARDDNFRSKGYGFVSYDSFEAADQAVESMNGQFLMNKAVTCQFAFKKDGKGERHGSQSERLLAAQARKNNAMGAYQGGMPGMAMAPPPPVSPFAFPSWWHADGFTSLQQRPCLAHQGCHTRQACRRLPYPERRLQVHSRYCDAHADSIAQGFMPAPPAGFTA